VVAHSEDALNIDEFIGERKGDWERLETIAAKARRGSSRNLSRDELWDLGRLYTGAVSDLSVLRSSPLAADSGSEVIAYLNALVVRVHGIIYKRSRFKWSSVIAFLRTDFPSTFRRNLLFVAVSAGIFVLFGAIGFLLGLAEPGFIELVVPDNIIRKVEGGKVWFDSLYTIAPQASSFLMTHNISVTFFVISLGMTFGIGAVYLLALNGLLLGTVAALCHNHGLSMEFWSFVLPHGSLELSAIIIAGGAGLILGHVLVAPGPYRRMDLLAERGRDVGMLAFGCVPLLVTAGVIEAFFSPSPVSAWLKIGVACTLFASLMGYLFTAGIVSEHAKPEESLPAGFDVNAPVSLRNSLLEGH